LATVTTAQTTESDGNPFRQRLLDALAACIDADGYRATTVASIVRRAHTSRRTFYEHFVDKEACFLALLSDKNDHLISQVVAAVDLKAPWELQVRQAVTAYIATAEAEPALVVSWIRDMPSLGSRAQAHQRHMLEGFVSLVQVLSDTPELKALGILPVPRPVAIVMIGGLRELIAWTVEDGNQLSGIVETAVQSSITLLQSTVARE
jgi:AcrR family transcriptional regulator